ncbi:hypothetical protein BX600DRAFT_512190 [Xylariales sp. PMI_506]|nr:hypothetical protein BX600DRAFT_512190 [Xylariales sp. PMI_506]
MDVPGRFFIFGLHDEDDGRHAALRGSEGEHQENYQHHFPSIPHSGTDLPQSPSASSSTVLIPPPPSTQFSLSGGIRFQQGFESFNYNPETSSQSLILPVSSVESVHGEIPTTTSTRPNRRLYRQPIAPDIRPLETISPQQAAPDISFLPSAPPLVPRRRRNRKTKQYTAEEEEQRRHRALANNRIAANKSRQKRKDWESDLEETVYELERQNVQLKSEHSALIAEASQIRTQLMGHAHCNDPNVNQWIENEARRFVIGAGTLTAAFTQMPPLHHHHHPLRQSTMSLSGYVTGDRGSNGLISPSTTTASTSIPRVISDSNSPVFFRGQLQYGTSGGEFLMPDSSYVLPTTTAAEDIPEFDRGYIERFRGQ